MTEIFEKNLKAMEKWYPLYAEQIREWAEGKKEIKLSESKIRIEEQTSWDKERIYRIEKEGRKLYLNGKRDAGDAAGIWQERLGEIHKYAPVFLVGLGSGIYLKKLCETADDTVNIIVYEPSVEIYFYTLEHVDLSECMKKRMIAWIVDGINEKGLSGALEKLVTVESVEYFKTEVHPNYQELFPNKVLDALRQAGRITMDIIININTGVNFAGYLARNQIQNMRFVLDGYNTMGLAKILDTSFPAILVAAGPSLNKNIKELKRAKNKAFILAVDTALKPLIKEGIIPDAFCTIDSKKPLSLVESDQIKEIPVITPVTANCELLRRQRGKKIFYYDGYILPFMAYLSVGKTLPGASSGGSVACSGFSLLYKMGFATIILVGQDLAYTGQKSHADGTLQDVMPKEDTSGMIMVKGNFEERVPTRTDFKKYIDWYDSYIKGAKEHRKELRVINATEGGAYIKNTEQMTLHDALEENCSSETDFQTAIQNMKSDFTGEDRDKIKEFLWDVSREFTEIRKDAKRLQTAYRKVDKLSKSKNMNQTEYVKQLKRIKKLSKKCESKTAYEMISNSMPLAEYIVKSESLEEMGSIEEQAKAVAMQGVKYAGFIGQCAELLQEYMMEAFSDFTSFQKS